MKRAALLSVLFLAIAPAVRAEPGADLEEAVAGFLAAKDLRSRVAAIPAILAEKPEPAALIALLEEDRERSEPARKGWQVRTHEYPDGVTRPYHLYVPTTYSGSSAYGVLFHMHGGVSRPELIPEEGMAGYRDWWTAQAEEWGFFVVFPLGQQGAEWWTETAAVGIEGILESLKADFCIDEDMVFATGFSDGGSGAFYLAMTHPTFFAGFIPLNGHPAVASRASGRQLYEVNAANRPLYIVNTQEDPLYRSADVLPFLRTMMRAGAQIRFTTYPGIGHTPGYRDEQNPLVAKWMSENPRAALPNRIVFETADAEIDRVAWLRILELGETPGAPRLRDFNTMTPRGRVLIGIYIDQAYEGAGVRVARITPGSFAESVGLEVGDVVVQVDDMPARTPAELRDALGQKDWGQPVRIAYTRDGDPDEVSGTFPEFTASPVYARGKPSGRIELTAEGNRIEAKLRGIRRYALDLCPALFDFESEIVVVTNGEESFRGMVEPDLRHLLVSFARDRDRRMLALARLVIEVR